MRSIWNKVTLGAIAVFACGITATGTHAQTTFATFVNNSNVNFRYDASANSLFSSNNGATAGAIPVNFRYSVATAYAPAFTDILATLTFVSTGGETVDGDGFLPLSNVSMVITANTPGIFGSNLLTLTGSTGRIRGTVNSNSIPVVADTALGNTVNFSSDYLSFANTTQRVLALTTPDASPNYAINGGTNRPDSFNATYVGTFASNPVPNAIAVVPEANTGLLAALALPLLGGIAVLRRRTAK